MKNKNFIQLTGKVEIISKDLKTGKIIDKQLLKNLIVNSGKERVTKLLGGVASDYFNAIALGEGASTSIATMTELESEVVREAVAGAYEADYKIVFQKEFTVGTGESYNITEAGIFDSATASGSTMLNRITFDSRTLDVDTSLEIKMTITIS